MDGGWRSYAVEVGRTGDLAMQVLVKPYGSSKIKNYVHGLSHMYLLCSFMAYIATWAECRLGPFDFWLHSFGIQPVQCRPVRQ